MSRGTIDGLVTPVAIGQLLPDVYRRFDDNMERLTGALDELLAPVWMSIDCFDSYLDPALAPADFVGMLSDWVGLSLDQNWTDEQARRLVASAVELYRWRGTRRGLATLVEAYTGTTPLIDDSGGAVISDVPGAQAPGPAVPSVRVVVELPSDSVEDLERLQRLIVQNVPAHVAVHVEVARGSAVAPVDPGDDS